MSFQPAAPGKSKLFPAIEPYFTTVGNIAIPEQHNLAAISDEKELQDEFNAIAREMSYIVAEITRQSAHSRKLG